MNVVHVISSDEEDNNNPPSPPASPPRRHLPTDPKERARLCLQAAIDSIKNAFISFAISMKKSFVEDDCRLVMLLFFFFKPLL